MKTNDSNRIPPPLPLWALALLVHERVFPSQPELVRARAVARAREVLRKTPVATPAPTPRTSTGVLPPGRDW